MVGFYLFTNRDGELYQVYESPFVPETELSTEPSFTIAPVSLGPFKTTDRNLNKCMAHW